MRKVLAVRRLFLDQEVVPYRLSYCNWADALQKAFIDSNRIGKKFGRIVLHCLRANTRRVFGLTSYFQVIGHDVRPPLIVAYASVSVGRFHASPPRTSQSAIIGSL